MSEVKGIAIAGMHHLTDGQRGRALPETFAGVTLSRFLALHAVAVVEISKNPTFL